MGKDKKKSTNSIYKYVVSGVTDIYYSRNETPFAIGFGDVYLLGIFDTFKDVKTFISEYNKSDIENEPIVPMVRKHENSYINYIVVEASLLNEFTYMNCDSITEEEHRTVFKYDAESSKYVKVTEDNIDKDFVRNLKACYRDVEFTNYIDSSIINLANTSFQLDGCLEERVLIANRKGSDSLNHLLKSPRMVDDDHIDLDEFKEALKEFISNPENKLTINDKDITSVDDLTDEEIEQAASIFNIKIDGVGASDLFTEICKG